MAEQCISSFASNTTADTHASRTKPLFKKRNRIVSIESIKLNVKNIQQQSTISVDETDNCKISERNINGNEIIDSENNSIVLIKNIKNSITPSTTTSGDGEDENENDDCNSAGSSTDISIPIDNGDQSNELTELKNIHCHRHDNNIIYLETPVIDDNNVCLVGSSHIEFEKSSAQPKRLSEEFLSSDDNDDGTTDDLSMSLSSSATKTTTSIETPSSTTTKRAEDELNGNQLQSEDNNVNGNFIPVSSNRSYLEDESSSSCSNIVDSKDESQLILDRDIDEDDEVELDDDGPTTSSLLDANSHVEIDGSENDVAVGGVNSGTLSSESTVSYYDNDVQSMDAIERRDFEHEQRITGGILLRTQSLVNSDKLNLEIISSYQSQNDVSKNLNAENSSSDCKFSTQREHTTTPTSSRNNSSRLTKTTAKINLSMSLDCIKDNTKLITEKEQQQKIILKKLQPSTSNQHILLSSSTSSSASSSSTSNNAIHVGAIKVDLYLGNSNSNDSLSSDKSYSTSSNHSLPNFSSKKPNDNSNSTNNSNKNNSFSTSEPIAGTSSGNSTINTSSSSNSKIKINKIENNEDDIDSRETSTSNAECSYSDEILCTGKNLLNLENGNDGIISNKINKINNYKSVRFNKKIIKHSYNDKIVSESNSVNPNLPIDILQSANEDQNNDNVQQEDENHNFDDEIIDNEDILVNDHQNETEFVDDETWADCEEGSDEEVCTCYNNNNADEDDLPSKDVDLSSYIQMVSISEEMFFQENATMSPDFSSVQQHQRKRKLNDTLLNTSSCTSTTIDIDNSFSATGSSRKRLALDYTSTPRSSNVNNYYSSPTTNTSNTLTPSGEHRRTPRSIIPTKDNPPPELHDWLIQFQRWSHAERLLAVDRLIEHCEPQQVRHMMKVIEPQFQRDFISLLPRELALQVLSYLTPKDLLRAAQTCRSWRFLCDDNLLWKEKCKSVQILTEIKLAGTGNLIGVEALPKRGRAGNMPPISSPWKAAYMRQHIIEMNWRTRPIRDPKILKGHDDHVITCLQFSGNRIVSGSDDNTLKVWSAVTGKCLRTLVGHTGGVWSSQMSENIIISGSTDRTLKVWDMETGQCIHTLLGHTSTVRCMHLHGKKVVSGSRDATLRVWDIEQGICLHVLVGHLAAVRCVQYDGKLIVSGAYDYMVKIWHPERQECLHTLQGHTNRVYSLQFDGIHVVSGSLDTSIRVWDAETGNPKHTLMGHQSLTSGMELRQNILVSGNADSTVKVWDITTGQCLQTLSGPNKHQSAVTCLQFNSRFVITSSDDGTVKLWDVKTGEFIRNLVALDSGGSGGVVWRIRANDTKLICAVGSRNGTEETKLMVLDFDVEGACVKCS